MPDSPHFDAFGASRGGFGFTGPTTPRRRGGSGFTTTCQSAEASITDINPVESALIRAYPAMQDFVILLESLCDFM